MVNGAFLGMSSDVCVIGIFKYPRNYVDQNAYYGGSLFMESYYVTLKMDPWEQNNNNEYLLMDVGPKNPNADLGRM